MSFSFGYDLTRQTSPRDGALRVKGLSVITLRAFPSRSRKTRITTSISSITWSALGTHAEIDREKGRGDSTRSCAVTRKTGEIRDRALHRLSGKERTRMFCFPDGGQGSGAGFPDVPEDILTSRRSFPTGISSP